MSSFYAYGTKMPWHVVSVIPEYPLLHVRFADEKKATFDLGNIMNKGIFFPVIKEEEMFNKVGVVDGAVTWAWGLDLAPDNLYKLALENPDTTIVL